jgi:GNAT superfamily N-acetyltransferase
MSEGYDILPMEPDEEILVKDSWVKSYRDSDWAGTVSNDRFAEVQRWTITDLLARGAIIRVAVNTQGPRRVLGWVCYEAPGLIHYVYCKHKARGLGLARALLAHAEAALGLTTPGRFTHRTRASTWLLRKGWAHWPAGARIKRIDGEDSSERTPSRAPSRGEASGAHPVPARQPPPGP